MRNEEEYNWQVFLREKNPQIDLFEAAEEEVGEDYKKFLVDMQFQQGILWIKVSHPSLVQLLFIRKTAIMSRLRALSTSLVVKDVRFLVSSHPSVSLEADMAKTQKVSVAFAPTGEVQGKIVEIQNEELRVLMENLSRSIREREERKERR